MTRLDAAALRRFFADEFPQSQVSIDAVTPDGVRCRRRVGFAELRPGGTVSGPVLMDLADAAAYAAILSRIGPVALAVTTHLSIDFLRKPASDRDVLAEARLLKLGKRLAVVSVRMRSEGGGDGDDDDALVAHASVTYSIPPDAARGAAR